MVMKAGKWFGLVTLLAVFGMGCAAETSIDDKLTQADAYLSEHPTEPGYRAVAHQLYSEVLADADSRDFKVRAHFGLGMIGFIDLIQGVPQLVAGLGGSDDEEGGTALPPAAELTETIDILLHEVLETGIADHFGEVLKEDDFAFTFSNFVFPATDPASQDIVLNGEWDMTEIGGIYGAIQVVLALEELVYAYDGVVETAIGALLSGGEIPALPENLDEAPAWLTETAVALGLDPLPWLDPAFGKTDAARLIPVRARLADGFGALADAMQYLYDEQDDQEENLLPKSNPVGRLLRILVGIDMLVENAIGGLVKTDGLQALFEGLEESVRDDSVAFAAPDWVWSLLDLVIGFSDFEGASDPISLGIPGVNLSSLFVADTHIADLKAVLPAFDTEGMFVYASEATDDTDRAQTVPSGLHALFADIEGRVDPANGVVDPLYLFFNDASFNGLLVPLEASSETTGPDYVADMDGSYENGDIMKLVSNLIEIVSSISL